MWTYFVAYTLQHSDDSKEVRRTLVRFPDPLDDVKVTLEGVLDEVAYRERCEQYQICIVSLALTAFPLDHQHLTTVW